MQALAEIGCQSQQIRLFSDELLVRAAGQVQLGAPVSQRREHGDRPGDEHALGSGPFRPQVLAPGLDFQHQAVVVDLLVVQRIFGASTPLDNLVGQPNHLVNRLLARQRHDEVGGAARPLLC